MDTTFSIYSENVYFSLPPLLMHLYKTSHFSFGFLGLIPNCFPAFPLLFSPHLAGIYFQNLKQIMIVPDLNFPVTSHPFWGKCQSSYSILSKPTGSGSRANSLSSSPCILPLYFSLFTTYTGLQEHIHLRAFSLVDIPPPNICMIHSCSSCRSLHFLSYHQKASLVFHCLV